MPIRRPESWQSHEFERWFDANPYLPDGERILIVGRQEPLGRMVVLIGLDGGGGLVILEVRNEVTDRRAIGAALEYLAQYEDASVEALLDHEDASLEALRHAFAASFGGQLPPLGPRRRVLLIAPGHDPFATACAGYLSRHLTGGTTIQLLRAAKSAGGFTFEEFRGGRLQPASALARGFAVSLRGRWYYVLEPGAAPVVWSLGKTAKSDGTFAIGGKPSRRAVRLLRGHLMPLRHPEGLDVSHNATVWSQRGRPDRLARVLGTIAGPVRGATVERFVAFALFQGEEFRSFRQRPADEFYRGWAPTDRPLPDWATIARLAQRRIETRRLAKRGSDT
jgi:hypothetical protein